MNKRHGGTVKHKSEYNSWRAMRERCYKPRYRRYDRYGGRGIIVCDRWRDSFANFYEDMGDKPSAKHTLDRINNDGNYEPSNCRWATQKEQLRNSSVVKLHTIDGLTDTVTGHIKRAKDRSISLVYKMMASGMSLEQALKTPNNGIEEKIKRNREKALAKRPNCAWCGIVCGKGAKRFCSQSHAMYHRNKYNPESFNLKKS